MSSAPASNVWIGLHAVGREHLDRQRRKAASTRRVTSQLEWNARIPELHGPLDLERFPFLREIYAIDLMRDQEYIFMKAAQIGLSTWAIRRALYEAHMRQRKVIYGFPTDVDMRSFSKDRVGPIIKRSEMLSAALGDTNTADERHFGIRGRIFFRGLTEIIESIDADILMIDEHDLSNQKSIAGSLARVTGPQSAGILARIGYPIIAGGGIAREFRRTDQRVWRVKCGACTTDNPIRGLASFEANVDKDTYELVCRSCRKPIDVRTGQWVATHPDGDRPVGYSLSKMLVPDRRVIKALVLASERKEPEEQETFYHRGLGEEYAAPDSKLTLEDLQRCVDPAARLLPGLRTDKLVTMGVDVATTRGFNVTIEEEIDLVRGRKVFVGVVQDIAGGPTAVQQLCALVVAYDVQFTVFDHLPEGRLLRGEFAKHFPGRAWSCGLREPDPNTTKLPEVWRPDEEKQHVSVIRSKAFETLFERYRKQHVVLPPLGSMPQEFAEHLCNVQRVTVKDEKRLTLKVMMIETGDEDFAQAEVYNDVARHLARMYAGITAVTGQGPVPLAEQLAAQTDLTSHTEHVDYRPGFSADPWQVEQVDSFDDSF